MTCPSTKSDSAQSVVATIEVKSYLGTIELKDTLDAIAVTKALFRSGEQIYHKGSVECRVPKPNPILTYIFAYDGLNLETLSDKIVTYGNEKNDAGISPDAVCILKKGVLLRSQFMPIVKGNHVTHPSFNNVKITGQHLTKDALFAFYRRLIDDVLPLRMVNIDLDGYYTGADLE